MKTNKSLTHVTSSGVNLVTFNYRNVKQMSESTSERLTQICNTIQSNIHDNKITKIVFGHGDDTDVYLENGQHGIYVSPEFTGTEGEGWFYLYENKDQAYEDQENMMKTGDYETGAFINLLKFKIEA